MPSFYKSERTGNDGDDDDDDDENDDTLNEDTLKDDTLKDDTIFEDSLQHEDLLGGEYLQVLDGTNSSGDMAAFQQSISEISKYHNKQLEEWKREESKERE